jgi:hypothetical protein
MSQRICDRPYLGATAWIADGHNSSIVYVCIVTGVDTSEDHAGDGSNLFVHVHPFPHPDRGLPFPSGQRLHWGGQDPAADSYDTEGRYWARWHDA